MARKTSGNKSSNVVSLHNRRPPPPAHIQSLLDEYLQWPHAACAGEHGVLKAVPPQDVPRVDAALLTVYGPMLKSWRLWVEGQGHYDIEFIVSSGAGVRPRKSWDYCGQSILFQAEQAKEHAAHVALERFSEGDAVVFTHDGKRKRGLVARVNPSRLTVVVHKEGSYYVPGKDADIDE